MAKFNYFENSTDDELKNYYTQYKSFQMEGVIPEESELRKAADTYIAKISGAWIVPFTTDLLETIADRWINLDQHEMTIIDKDEIVKIKDDFEIMSKDTIEEMLNDMSSNEKEALLRLYIYEGSKFM